MCLERAFIDYNQNYLCDVTKHSTEYHSLEDWKGVKGNSAVGARAWISMS